MSMTKLAFFQEKKMKELLMKYKEIIMYLIFGTLTTAVNIVVYYLS